MRTVTFTMEDALISPAGLAILTGAGLIEAETKSIKQHIIETVDITELRSENVNAFNAGDKYQLIVKKAPFAPSDTTDLNIYVMGLDSHGEVITEPYLYTLVDQYEQVTSPTVTDFNANKYYKKSDAGEYSAAKVEGETFDAEATYYIPKGEKATRTIELAATGNPITYTVDGKSVRYTGMNGTVGDTAPQNESEAAKAFRELNNKFANAEAVLVDYYTEVKSGAFEIDITPDKFGGSFYLEASTLWRDQGTGQDLSAEFIIPNCRVQSNFTFTMASSGDPSSFTFTMDAFPDYTRYDRTEKVLARIQVIGATTEGIADIYRTETWSKDKDNTVFGGTAEKEGQGEPKTMTGNPKTTTQTGG